MKQRDYILGAAIATALLSAPGPMLAQSTTGRADLSIGNTSEAPRVTQAVNTLQLTTLAKTHLAFVPKAASSVSQLPANGTMSHLQLVLKPSAMRQAAMEAFIANQHDPKSASYQKWLTPEQFGEQFGVLDSDITAVTAWLTAQGFTVNHVYPNKMQIDFNGTTAQVNQAFHTQENIYTIGQVRHVANAGDISIPAALQPVVVGVMGLNDFHPTSLNNGTGSVVAKWNASKKGFAVQGTTKAATSGKSQAIPIYGGATRALAPNDLATMYNVKPLRANGVTGRGVTLAIVGDGTISPNSWAGFTHNFNLNQYGAQISLQNPAPSSGPNNCYAPAYYGEEDDTMLSSAEWSTAMAPGINLLVASCSDWDPDFNPVTDYWFGGTYIATTNIINTDNHPDIISFGYAAQEFFLDSADMSALNLMWAQADAEGISVFVATGDSGSNPGFAAAYQAINGQVGNPGVSANGAATSPHVTAVGGTDLADIYDGTTNKYFAPIPSVVGGSALSYVPEIPWNESCGNGVVAKSLGFDSAVEFCQSIAASDPHAYYLTSMSGSGGPSTVNAKPAWQRQVFNAAKDQSRDIPDVSLFAGSYGQHTYVVTCQDAYPCSAPDFSTNMMLMSSTSVSTAMFAGIQALIDQGLAMRGLAVGQGNAAPTLYALAAQEYGSSSGPAPASLATCNADNGATGTDNCVFHNITRGSISSQCYEDHLQNKRIDFTTSNCYYYFDNTTYWPERVVEPYVGDRYLGLTTTDAAPSAYGVSNKAFGAQPGWSFASGLGSVNATNLLIAWRAFVHAPATMATSP